MGVTLEGWAGGRAGTVGRCPLRQGAAAAAMNLLGQTAGRAARGRKWANAGILAVADVAWRNGRWPACRRQYPSTMHLIPFAPTLRPLLFLFGVTLAAPPSVAIRAAIA